MMAPLGPVEEMVGKDRPLNNFSSLKTTKIEYYPQGGVSNITYDLNFSS